MKPARCRHNWSGKMDILEQMHDKARELGVRNGESAAEFRARDPKAADLLAEFQRANMGAIVREIAGVVGK
jgi:hypothetical protein